MNSRLITLPGVIPEQIVLHNSKVVISQLPQPCWLFVNYVNVSMMYLVVLLYSGFTVLRHDMQALGKSNIHYGIS